MSTKARLYKFLIDMERLKLEEVEEPYQTELREWYDGNA